jgi:1,4-alpha-glucan branching enzyme
MEVKINEKTLMKHNKNHDNGKAAGPELVPVRFEFTHPTARTVSVAGCFNNWQPGAKALHPSGEGRWLNETALKPGTYEYRFVVDGQWIPDPLVMETVPNPFGGRNSVLRIASTPVATQLAEAEHVPLKNANKRNALIL